MRKNFSTFNWVQKPSYSSASWINETQVIYGYNVIASSISSETVLTISYSELDTRLQSHFGLQGHETDAAPSALQQYRNHLTTLNSFLAFVGKTIEGNVGPELLSRFDECRKSYLSSLSVAQQTKYDRSSHLRLLHSWAKVIQIRPSSSHRNPTSLSEVLRQAIAKSDLPPKTFALRAGVDPMTLVRWMNGGGVNRRGYSSLSRLERELGMERGTLLGLVRPEKQQSTQHAQVPEFRRRLANVKSPALVLPESALSDGVIEEWKDLFNYKVGASPRLKRQARGTWRLIPLELSKRMSTLATRRNMVCPTAASTLYYFRSFFGVLTQLPVKQGGVIGGAELPLTLSWFAVPEMLSLYLDWYTDRSNGVKHNGQRVFARAVASLLRADTGYLWQQPALRNSLPEKFRPATDDEWRKGCEAGHEYLRSFIRGAKGISRRPNEPIDHLLNSEQPLKPLFDLISKLDKAAAECVPGSAQEARCKRNALLIALLISNPLRERTIASLTWLPDGTGSVRGSSKAGWRIVLTEAQLKNGASKGSTGYDVRVADWVKPRLEAYLDEYRDVLLGKLESPYFFVGSKTGRLWEGVSDTVFKLSRQYIPGSPGFGAHAIRHLVATDWLRNNPGDFLTVAKVLNDRIETVIENYAHLSRDDSFIRYEEFLEKRRQPNSPA